jgi:hypothetical protein
MSHLPLDVQRAAEAALSAIAAVRADCEKYAPAPVPLSAVAVAEARRRLAVRFAS